MLDHLDLKNSVKLAQSIAPQVVDDDVEGVGVDLRDCESEILVIVSLGDTVVEGVDPDPDVPFEGTLKIQQSLNDDTDNNEAVAEEYADITGATLDLADLENEITTLRVRIRSKRYVRAIIEHDAGEGVISVQIMSTKRIL